MIRDSWRVFGRIRRVEERGESALGERQIAFHHGFVCFGDEARLSKRAFALGIFPPHEVPGPFFPAEDFSRTGYFEAFGHRFAGLGFSCSSGHGGGK